MMDNSPQEPAPRVYSEKEYAMLEEHPDAVLEVASFGAQVIILAESGYCFGPCGAPGMVGVFKDDDAQVVKYGPNALEVVLAACRDLGLEAKP